MCEHLFEQHHKDVEAFAQLEASFTFLSRYGSGNLEGAVIKARAFKEQAFNKMMDALYIDLGGGG